MRTSQTPLSSLLGPILFALTGLSLLGIGLFTGMTALYAWLSGEPVRPQQTILAAALIFEAALLFTAAYFTLPGTGDDPGAARPAYIPVTRLQLLLAIVVAAAALLTGSWIGGNSTLDWLLLPVLTIPAIVIPLGLILILGTRALPPGSRRQSWSVLGLGMSLTPVVLLAVEAALAVVVFGGVLVYLTFQPGLVHEFELLFRQVMVPDADPEAVLQVLAPFLTRPGVIFTALLYMALLVPAVEELVKPLGVWLLAGRLDSAAQGFTLGAISGAAYSLVETIGVSGQAGEWGGLLFTRVGTGLLHITTSAIVGAAIVGAQRERRYLRGIAAYLFAVLLHGLWNACAVLYTFSALATLTDHPGWLGTLQPWVVAAMILLAGGLFGVLVFSNRRLRQAPVQ